MGMYQHIKYTSDFRDFLFIDKKNKLNCLTVFLFVTCLNDNVLAVLGKKMLF